MALFLDEFPMGQVLVSGNDSVEYPASFPHETADSTSSALAKLANRPLNKDRYLMRLLPEVVTHFDKMRRKTLAMLMMDEVQIQLEVRIPNVHDASDKVKFYDLPHSDLRFRQVTSVHITLNIAIPSHTQGGAVETGTPKAKKRRRKRPSGTMLNNIQQALVVFDAILLFNTILVDAIEVSLANTTALVKERNIKTFRQLKKWLVEYSRHIDKILLYYTNTNSDLVQELPGFEDINKSKTEIQNLISHMNPEDLKNLFPGDVGIMPEYILCSVIGLKNSYGDRLHQLSEDAKSHQSSEYFLKEFVQQNYGEYGDHYCGDIDSSMLVEILCEIGFTESRSALIADWIQNLSTKAKEHQPLSYWIHVYIDELFRYDILLNDTLSPAYPFNEDQVDKWSSVDINRDGSDEKEENDEEENEDCSAPVMIMNTRITSYKSLTRDEVAYPPHDDSGAYWYHGTDARHAKHILENGIKTEVGATQQDFSNGNGFYMSPSYEYAVDWAKHYPNPAVIVFKIDPDKMFTSGYYKLLDLREKQADWSQIVHYHRCGETKRICSLSKDLQKDLRGCDGIRGAMCTLRSGDKPKKQDWKPRGFSRTERMQLCIRSDKLAEEFGKLKNTDSAIFFSKRKSA